jgi:propionate CoA-transferase
VTERCVFRLMVQGLALIEIAPGIDLQRDILDQMDFAPQVSADLKLMDARIFAPPAMGWRAAPDVTRRRPDRA